MGFVISGAENSRCAAVVLLWNKHAATQLDHPGQCVTVTFSDLPECTPYSEYAGFDSQPETPVPSSNS
jgi:hypothetical protein